MLDFSAELVSRFILIISGVPVWFCATQTGIPTKIKFFLKKNIVEIIFFKTLFKGGV